MCVSIYMDYADEMSIELEDLEFVHKVANNPTILSPPSKPRYAVFLVTFPEFV